MKYSLDQVAKDLRDWEVRTHKQQSDLVALFQSDRSLFAKLAAAKITAQEAKKHLDLTALAKLARSSVQMAEGKGLETKQIARKKASLKAKGPKGRNTNKLEIHPLRSPEEEKIVRFSGTPISKNRLFVEMPEVTSSYERVLAELRKRPATASQLSKSAGISKKQTAAILERLRTKKLIKERKHNQKRSFYFAPHR